MTVEGTLKKHSSRFVRPITSEASLDSLNHPSANDLKFARVSNLGVYIQFDMAASFTELPHRLK